MANPDFADTELANNVSLFPLGLVDSERRYHVVSATPPRRMPDVDIKARLRAAITPDPIRLQAAADRADAARRDDAQAEVRAKELRAAHDRGWSTGFQRGIEQTERRHRGERAYWLACGIAVGIAATWLLSKAPAWL